MLSEQTIRIVKATAPAVAAHAEAITRRFYSLIFSGNPEVKAFFNQAHQHSGGQQKALAGAICAYAANIENLGVLEPAVELIAQKHCSLGIQADQYPIVGKHLLVAVRDVLGAAATDEVIAAWGQAYGFLSTVLIDREAQIYKDQAAVPGGWNGYRRFYVEYKVPESETVTSFYLRPTDGGALAPFKPGQYITVRFHNLPTPTSPRNYSLSDRPGLGHYRITVQREGAQQPGAPEGLVSSHLHDQVKVGDTLEIGPPCGEFTLEPAQASGRAVVLLAGGIGITPLLAMLKNLADQRVTSPVYVIHGARNSRVHAMADELRMVAASMPTMHTHIRYSTPLPDDLSQRRCDSTGFVDLGLLRSVVPTNDADFYFCGPRPFMQLVYRGLKAWGVEESRLHWEFFGPREEITALA